MGCDIDEIDTIGEGAREALATRGVTNTNHLLKRCATAKGRRELSQMTRVAETDLLQWAQLAELLRLPSLNKRSLNLLWAAGVRSLEDMRRQDRDRLIALLAEAKSKARNAQKIRLPSVAMVEGWIAQAPETESKLG